MTPQEKELSDFMDNLKEIALGAIREGREVHRTVRQDVVQDGSVNGVSKWKRLGTGEVTIKLPDVTALMSVFKG